MDRLLATLGDGDREPALYALLRGEKSMRLEHQIETGGTRKHVLAGLRTLKQSLYRYQHEGVERFLARGRLLLPDDMGLGKTAQAIAACHVSGTLATSAESDHRDLPHVSSSGFMTDSSSPKLPLRSSRAPPANGALCLRRAGADSFWRTTSNSFALDIVREWTPDIVVLDEAQRIKIRATKTALTVKRLDPPYRLVVVFERSGGFHSRIERIVAPTSSAAPVLAEDARIAEDDAAENEIEAVVVAADESCDVAHGAAAGTAPMPSAADIQRPVSDVSVQRTAGGGLVIEAPPETVSTLTALFAGMAQLLQSAMTPRVLGGGRHGGLNPHRDPVPASFV